MRASPESPRMFENDVVDFFTRIPWWTVPLIWVPIVVAMNLHGVWTLGLSPAVSLVVFCAGLFAWTLGEYVMHRTFFHWKPPGKWGARMHFIAHGVHHEWPQDRYRLVLPPAASFFLASMFFGLFWLLLGPVYVFPFMAGYLVGYMAYDCTHYALHHAKWRNRVFVRLKAHHMNHHHNDSERKFGVSNTLWDHVFGTY